MTTPHIISTTVLPNDEYFGYPTDNGFIIILVTPSKPTVKVFSDLGLNSDQINNLFNRLIEAEKVANLENNPVQVSVTIR